MKEKYKKIEEIFDYYIKQKHCRPVSNKTSIKNMCQRCRNMYYLKEELKELKLEILLNLKSKLIN